MKQNNRWDQLSLHERAGLIKLYLESGITDLYKMREHYNGVPYRDFNSSEYDYFNASPENMPSSKEEHWTSRNPYTGQILKRNDHPTYDLMVEGERQAGYDIIKNINNLEYSFPKNQSNYVEYSNDFNNGGYVNELPSAVVTPNGNYIKYSNNNLNVSKEDYINARIEEDRVKAVNNILNLQSPLVPIVPNKEASKAIKRGMNESEAISKFGCAAHPHTCINTTTGMFPKGSRVPGNKTFARNPNQYGFEQVKDVQKGDMLQLLNNFGIPYHSVLVTGFAENGNPLVTYSNGGIDEDINNDGRLTDKELHMRYNKDNLYLPEDQNGFGLVSDDEFNIFRYVGNENQRKE